MSGRFSLPSILKVFTALIVLTYIICKAYVSSFTHDESLTYLNHVDKGFMPILSFADHYTNNHILNTLLMKYSEMLLGTSEFALRLPNLLLFCVYLLYCFRIFKKINPWIALSVFILLCSVNPLTDLFGLARGYGLSCGFMIMSLFHFTESFSKNKSKNILLFHLAAILAILSNFTMLDYYAVMLLIYNLVLFTERKIILKKGFNFFHANRIHIAPFLVALITLYEPVRQLLKTDQLNFGGHNGFFRDTVGSLIDYLFYYPFFRPSILLALQIIITTIVLISTSIIIRKIATNDKSFFSLYKPLIISNFLLVFISIAIVTQHIFMKADYPVHRFSAFLAPLYIIHFGFLVSWIYETYHFRMITISACLILAAISAAGEAYKANLYSCSEWGFDAETKNMMLILSSDHSRIPGTQVKMEISWLFEPTINFYRKIMNLSWLNPVDRSGISGNADYYYLFKKEIKLLKPENATRIYEFNNTHTLLLKDNRQKVSEDNFIN